MEQEMLFELTSKVMSAARKATISTDSNGIEKKELIMLLKKTYRLYPDEFWSVIMAVRGQALRYRLSLNQIIVLNQSCWTISEESDDDAVSNFFRKLATNLKPKVCEIFRAPLSGGEVFYHNEKGNKRYAFSRIPEDSRQFHGIRFSISRLNTQAILRAYDSLMQNAKEEKNGLMLNHWKIQKQAFLTLVEHAAPKLLISGN